MRFILLAFLTLFIIFVMSLGANFTMTNVLFNKKYSFFFFLFFNSIIIIALIGK